MPISSRRHYECTVARLNINLRQQQQRVTLNSSENKAQKTRKDMEPVLKGRRKSDINSAINSVSSGANVQRGRMAACR